MPPPLLPGRGWDRANTVPPVVGPRSARYEQGIGNEARTLLADDSTKFKASIQPDTSTLVQGLRQGRNAYLAAAAIVGIVLPRTQVASSIAGKSATTEAPTTIRLCRSSPPERDS
jgi:hypothetical protein